MDNNVIEYKIVKHIGTIAESFSGWTKELNIVSWNGNPPKFDIREWHPEHDRMTRGITLYEEEAAKLTEVLAEYFATEERKEA